MSTPWRMWVAGARPRTLPAAVVPVAVGTAAGFPTSGRFFVAHVTLNGRAVFAGAFEEHHVSILNAAMALVVALFIQIGTNYVNDYADGQRGTDESRVGPVRLVGGGHATVSQVKWAALISFGIAGIAGLVLAYRVSWWLVPVGLVCGIAGWAYTGGPHPYGYLGFGEVFVFIFFGLVATAGSAFVQHAPNVTMYMGRPFDYNYPWGLSLWAGVPVGFLAAALLQANNLRDLQTDKESGKKTLAVRLGRKNAGAFYAITLMGVALSVGVLQHYRGYSLLALIGLPLAFYPLRMALGDRSGRRLLPMLGATSRLQLAVGLLLTIGILL